jgi:hypothetical protein
VPVGSTSYRASRTRRDIQAAARLLRMVHLVP